MISNKDLYYNFLLLNSLNESAQFDFVKPIKFFTHKNCGGRLNSFQLLKLNEAYTKFIKLETLLSEKYNPYGLERIHAWNNFILFEDRATPNKGYLLREFLGAAAKWIHKKLGGKSRINKGGSFLGLGSKSRAQKAEYESMKETQKELMDVIEKSVSPDYPNNDDVKQFEKETQAVLDNADKFIKNSPVEIRPEMYRTLKKWVVYQLDQKVSSYYQDHMESKSYRLPRLDEAEKKEGEPSSKEGEKEGDKKERKPSAALDDSETVKQLQSKVFPKFLKFLSAGGALVTAGVLYKYPEILKPTTYGSITAGDTAKVTADVGKTLSQKIPDATITGRYGPEITDQYFDHVGKHVQLQGDPANNSKDLVKYWTEMGNGNANEGAKQFFSQVKIDDPGGKNSAYVLDRLNKGMSVDDAWKMPGSQGGYMERMGGGAGIPVKVGGLVAGVVARQLVTKTVSTALTKIMASAGILSAPAWAPYAAAVGAAVGIGGLLSSWFIKSRRERSLTKSRLAFLNGLRDKIDELEKNPPTEPPPAEPPPDEPAPSAPPDEGDIEDKEDKPRKCTDDQIKQKVLDYLKTTKSIDADKHEAIANILTKEFANEDFQPQSVEDLARSIPSMPRLKKLRPTTAAALANAVKDCFDFEGDIEDREEKEPAQPLTDDEVERVANLVTSDVFSYQHGNQPNLQRKYTPEIVRTSNRRAPPVTNKVKEIVKLLSDKGKLTVANLDADENKSSVYKIPDYSKIGGKQKNDPEKAAAREKADDSFPSQVGTAEFTRAEKILADPEIKKAVGDNDLVVYMLGGRKALVEMVAFILRRSAMILSERVNRKDSLVLERWQKMAGLITS